MKDCGTLWQIMKKTIGDRGAEWIWTENSI